MIAGVSIGGPSDRCSKCMLITLVTAMFLLSTASAFACGNVTEAKKAELIKYGNYFGAEVILSSR